jgi:Flp pilus assembly protein TadG
VALILLTNPICSKSKPGRIEGIMIYSKPTMKRRGAIAPLAAFLMIFLIGMVAFAVDIGWIVLAKTNLQNTADAAALAGADPLMNGYVQYNLAATNALKTTVLNSALASARTYAKQYAGYNSAGGVSSLTLNDSDIEFGFLDAKNNYTPMPIYTGFPNTIKVTMRLDNQANKPLSLFFGPAMGTRTTNVIATASATIYTGTVNSFSSTSTYSGLLPFTYDVNFWNNFLKTGQDPNGNSMTDANGVPELQVYPIKNYTGNFGQLSLDDSHVGNTVEASWITNGASPSDIKALQTANLIPLADHPANTWNWVGDTGMKSSLVSTLNNYVGQNFVLPLFQPVNAGVPNPSNYQPAVGNGSQYYFNIVQFVGVQIMPSPKNNGQVIIQPAAIIDPNAVFNPGSVTPAGTSSQVVTTFTTPKLTR